MLQNPHFVSTDESRLCSLVDHYPWAAIVSATDQGMVASHYPIVWESSAGTGELTLVTHFGRPDDVVHGLGSGDVLVIVQGPHAYISSSWYPEGHFVPTWNHVTAHVRCTVELLSPEANFEVLKRLVDKFEGAAPGVRRLDNFGRAARNAALGTVGVRLRGLVPTTDSETVTGRVLLGLSAADWNLVRDYEGPMYELQHVGHGPANVEILTYVCVDDALSAGQPLWHPRQSSPEETNAYRGRLRDWKNSRAVERVP